MPEFVSVSAENSVNWRFDLWEYCLRDLPRYLLVGKGIVFDVAPLAWLNQYFYGTPEFFYEAHQYHSGIFSLLLDFGLLGLISAGLFFITSNVENVRKTNRLRGTSGYVGFAKYTAMFVMAKSVSYFLVHGDLLGAFQRVLIWGALVNVLLNSLLKIQDDKDQSALSAEEYGKEASDEAQLDVV